MTKFTTLAGAGALILMSTAAFAAPCSTGTTVSTEKDASKASNVDPNYKANTSPGAKSESPGTVGAMNNAGSAAAASPTGAQRPSNPQPGQQANKGDC